MQRCEHCKIYFELSLCPAYTIKTAQNITSSQGHKLASLGLAILEDIEVSRERTHEGMWLIVNLTPVIF